jgi:class 3 adenylate cyclase
VFVSVSYACCAYPVDRYSARDSADGAKRRSRQAADEPTTYKTVLKPHTGDLFDELAAPPEAAAATALAADKPITVLEPQASAEVNLPRSEKVVLMVDLVESVRLMAVDETGTISRWHRFISNAQIAVLPAHQGRMVKSTGDGLLAEFDDCKQAVEAAFVLHASLQDAQIGIGPNQAMRMRAGIHSTHVWRDSTDS